MGKREVIALFLAKSSATADLEELKGAIDIGLNDYLNFVCKEWTSRCQIEVKICKRWRLRTLRFWSWRQSYIAVSIACPKDTDKVDLIPEFVLGQISRVKKSYPELLVDITYIHLPPEIQTINSEKQN
jgi:hypothetical protein